MARGSITVDITIRHVWMFYIPVIFRMIGFPEKWTDEMISFLVKRNAVISPSKGKKK